MSDIGELLMARENGSSSLATNLITGDVCKHIMETCAVYLESYRSMESSGMHAFIGVEIHDRQLRCDSSSVQWRTETIATGTCKDTRAIGK